jgi:nicotinamide-nucleotide adenylyltransferase
MIFYCELRIAFIYFIRIVALMLTGLFIGRFQPFHLGHMTTIKFALNYVEELVVVIGSAQKSHEIRHPFTAGERIQMINNSLNADNEVNTKRILLIPIPDIDIHSLWTHQIDVLVPSYSVVFTNDYFTTLLFNERGIKVIQPRLYQREELSATEIRSRIANNGDWKKLVTPQTTQVIESIAGVQRIKTIFAKNAYSNTSCDE